MILLGKILYIEKELNTEKNGCPTVGEPSYMFNWNI